MRRILDLLTWVLVIVSVSAVFCLSSAPDVEASLGVPACAARPHTVFCRYCATNQGKRSLPGVIDGYNVRFVHPDGNPAAGRHGL